MVWRSLHHKEILLSELGRNRRECILTQNSPLYTTAHDSHILSIELISKTGYWLRVCRGWFYLLGLPRAVRNASRARITKWKNLAYCGIRTWASRLRSEGATTELRRLMFVEVIKAHLILTVLYLEIYLRHMVDVTKLFVVNYIL